MSISLILTVFLNSFVVNGFMIKCPGCGRSVGTLFNWYDQRSRRRLREAVRRYMDHLYPIDYWDKNGGEIDPDNSHPLWCVKSGAVVKGVKNASL